MKNLLCIIAFIILGLSNAYAQNKAEDPVIMEEFIVHGTNVAARKSPKDDSKTVATFKEGEKVMVLKRENASWFKVIYNGEKVYITSASLSPDTINPAAEFTPTFETKPEGSYTPSNQTIHTGPRGGKYKINSKGNKVYQKRK